MQKPMFSVRDSKAEIYNPPFTALTDAEAVRSFTRLTLDPQSNISQFPEDFDLYKIGQFDDQTGSLNVFDTPQHVVKAAHILSNS